MLLLKDVHRLSCSFHGIKKNNTEHALLTWRPAVMLTSVAGRPEEHHLHQCHQITAHIIYEENTWWDQKLLNTNKKWQLTNQIRPSSGEKGEEI